MIKFLEVAVETDSEIIRKGDRFPIIAEQDDMYIVMIHGHFFPFTMKPDENGLINGEWILVDLASLQ